MSTTRYDIALRTPDRLSKEQVMGIANTNLVPKHYRGKVPDILACILTGRELGISDMHALRSIYVVDGAPRFTAEFMVDRVRSKGHSISGEISATEAVVRGKRRDTGDEMTSTWTMEMAERAKLIGKSNWASYPEAMLWARAVSQLCRMLFADAFGTGAIYGVDEEYDDAEPDDAPAEVIEPQNWDDGDPGDETPEPPTQEEKLFPAPEGPGGHRDLN